ncbi:MAG: FHA domain-containing protein [Bacteroidetes bacterium]|nr:FHA domain-containing protein [Bacteroidota bacterium]
MLPVPDASFKVGLPKITCPKCKVSFVPVFEKVNGMLDKTVVLTKQQIEPTAWLIVHDEQAPLQTFEIIAGNYVIGRKSNSKPCDIMVETKDMTMSRNHFIIEAMTGKGFSSYKLSDCKSTNHTFVNTISMQDVLTIGKEKYSLKDGDVIQAGQTKVEFKIKSSVVNSALEATKIIAQKGFAKTVLLNK